MAEFLFSVVIELLTNDGNRKIIPKYFVYTFLLQLCVVYGMVREGDGKRRQGTRATSISHYDLHSITTISNVCVNKTSTFPMQCLCASMERYSI